MAIRFHDSKSIEDFNETRQGLELLQACKIIENISLISTDRMFSAIRKGSGAQCDAFLDLIKFDWKRQSMKWLIDDRYVIIETAEMSFKFIKKQSKNKKLTKDMKCSYKFLYNSLKRIKADFNDKINKLRNQTSNDRGRRSMERTSSADRYSDRSRSRYSMNRRAQEYDRDRRREVITSSIHMNENNNKNTQKNNQLKQLNLNNNHDKVSIEF